MAKQSNIGADSALVAAAGNLYKSQNPVYDFSSMTKDFETLSKYAGALKEKKSEENKSKLKNATEAAELSLKTKEVDGSLLLDLPKSYATKFKEVTSQQDEELADHLSKVQQYGLESPQGVIAKAKIEEIAQNRADWAKGLLDFKINSATTVKAIADKNTISDGEPETKKNKTLQVAAGNASINFVPGGGIEFTFEEDNEVYKPGMLYGDTAYKGKDIGNAARTIVTTQMTNAAKLGQQGKYTSAELKNSQIQIETVIEDFDKTDVLDLAIGGFGQVKGPMAGLSLDDISKQYDEDPELFKQRLVMSFVGAIDSYGQTTQQAYEQEQEQKRLAKNKPTSEQDTETYVRNNYGNSPVMYVNNKKFRAVYKDDKIVGYNYVVQKQNEYGVFEDIGTDPTVVKSADQMGSYAGVKTMTWKPIPGE